MNTADQNGNETSRKEWFYRFRRGTRVGPLAGPFTLEELRGRLTADDYAWKKGMSDWMRAGDIGELATLFHTRKAEEERTTSADHSQGTTEPSTKVPAGGEGGMYAFFGVLLPIIVGIVLAALVGQNGMTVAFILLLTILVAAFCFALPALLFCGSINARAVELVSRFCLESEGPMDGWTATSAKVFFFLAGISTGGIVFAIEMLIIVLAAKGERGKKVEKEESPSGQAIAPAAP